MESVRNSGARSTDEVDVGPRTVAEAFEILDLIPAIVTQWDTEMRCVFANRTAVEFHGRKRRADMIGVHARDLVGEAMFDATLPYVQRALAGETQELDRQIVVASGAVRHNRLTVTPWLTGQEIVGFQVLVVDLSTRAAAESQRLQRATKEAQMLARHEIAMRQNDRVTQRLFAATLDLAGLVDLERHDAQSRIAALITSIDRTIVELRDSLDGPMLDSPATAGPDDDMPISLGHS
jgi:PAS domain S-box-containing protein